MTTIVSIEKMKKLGRACKKGDPYIGDQYIYFRIENFLKCNKKIPAIEDQKYTHRQYAETLNVTLCYDIKNEKFVYSHLEYSEKYIDFEMIKLAIERIVQSSIKGFTIFDDNRG